MKRCWGVVVISILIFASCGAKTTKPSTKAPESTTKKQNKPQTTTTTNNNFKFITMTGLEKECCLDLKANKISKLTIELDVNSGIETINIQVLYENMMLIGEKTISITKNRFDRIVILEDINITIPESAVDGQKIVVYAKSDKATQAKLEYGLQNQSPKETGSTTDEQKRADLIAKHKAETDIKNILINETNKLAFIDGSNNIIFYFKAYDNEYELNTKFNIGNCEIVCARVIINLPQIDYYRGFCLFIKRDNQLNYVLCKTKQAEGFIEEPKMQTVTEPVINETRKVYVSSDGRTFFSIDSKNEISSVFYKEDYTECFYSIKYPDSFFASFGGPDGPPSGYVSLSFIDGSIQKVEPENPKNGLHF